LEYAQDAISIGGVPTSDWRFRGDDLYDPDYTGSGHQPTYFDQLMAMYNRFQVLGSRIRAMVTPTSTSSAPVPAVNFCITPNDDNGALSWTDARQLPYARSRLVTAANGATLMNQADSAQIHGVPQMIVGLSSYVGTSSSSPSDPWYWHVVTETPDAATNITGFLSVVIEYDVVFFDRKLVTSS